MRKYPLIEGKVYHTFTKSIAGFEIFRNELDYQRMGSMLSYYKVENPPVKFSIFSDIKNKEFFYQRHFYSKDNLVEIIAYCFMPTHIHLVLLQLKKDGISIFMSKVLNSYTRYFNIKNKRKGPLWEGRFKNVEVGTDEQLLHLTRYIHLNPVTANLVEDPRDWSFSSYKEYLGEKQLEENICNYSRLLDIVPQDYKKFVSSRKEYQRELAELKELFLD
ncbi:MAG: transposase [Nitrospirota bacterium]|nr:transposase [Nitrospirota bacterium]